MQIVTANRLTDGRVVFRDRDGRWVSAIAGAAVLDAAAAKVAVEASQADVAARLIVEPYAIDVVQGPAGIAPKTMREQIRAGGPTSGSEVADTAAASRAA
jgi:sulfite reductase (NADPH) hemoprotein beta-component